MIFLAKIFENFVFFIKGKKHNENFSIIKFHLCKKYAHLRVYFLEGFRHQIFDEFLRFLKWKSQKSRFPFIIRDFFGENFRKFCIFYKRKKHNENFSIIKFYLWKKYAHLRVYFLEGFRHQIFYEIFDF